MSLSFDFDRIIDRTPTSSLKWAIYKGRDVVPLWVADMDFESPPKVISALRKRVDHGVFGYTKIPDDLPGIIVERIARLYSWEIDPAWIIEIPCLVTGLNLSCRSVGEDGDSVLSVTPIYPPFLAAPRHSRRKLLTCPLIKQDDRWIMDMGSMDETIDERTGLFLFCNPHNPTGRIYTRQELMAVAEWCDKRNLVICSDEIHCDLIMDRDARHIPIASIGPEIADRTITLMSPSKTFNIAGLGFGFAIISNNELRDRFKKEMAGIVPHINLMGYTAAKAAYLYGEEWLEAVLEYLRENRDLLQETVARFGQISMTHVEATYLGWIDIRKLELSRPHVWFEKHGLGFSNGGEFGNDDFVRFNFGCPRSIMNKALDRFATAIESIAA